MKEENIEKLIHRLKAVGIKDGLEALIRQNIAAGPPDFTLMHQTVFGAPDAADKLTSFFLFTRHPLHKDEYNLQGYEARMLPFISIPNLVIAGVRLPDLERDFEAINWNKIDFFDWQNRKDNTNSLFTLADIAVNGLQKISSVKEEAAQRVSEMFQVKYWGYTDFTGNAEHLEKLTAAYDRRHSFPVTGKDDFTLRQAYNFLNGRAILKTTPRVPVLELTPRSWLLWDEGAGKTVIVPERVEFNLAEELLSLPLQRIDPEKIDRLVAALEQGDQIPASYLEDDIENAVLLAADPLTNGLTIRFNNTASPEEDVKRILADHSVTVHVNLGQSLAEQNLLLHGFSPDLIEPLREHIAAADRSFTLNERSKFGNDQVTAELHFYRYPGEKDPHFSEYRLSVVNESEPEKTLTNMFGVEHGNGFTKEEAYNLLKGAAISKVLVYDKETVTKPWLKIDFDNPSDGNYPIKIICSEKDYDLPAELNRYPIKDFEDAETKETVIDLLRRGYTCGAVFESEGIGKTLMITADPEDKKLIIKDPLTSEQISADNFRKKTGEPFWETPPRRRRL